MANEATQSFVPDKKLQQVILEYQAARAAGQACAPHELLKQHPDIAEPLRAYFGLPPDSTEKGETPDGAVLEAPTLPFMGQGAEVPPRAREFGDYELLEELGRGGMGVVFKARQKSLNRVVAIKMILAGQLASEEQVRRFHVEAEEGGSLDHPNIVPIYQVGEEQDQLYFTMKFIDGGSLRKHVADYQNDLRAGARLVAVVAQAVHYAHQRGILHRDLKPGNILLDAQKQPQVTDFGLAKHLGSQGEQTQSGQIIGTPSYMSPEQAAARKDLSTAVDVYSLGAILYEMVTREPPFQSDSTLETVRKVVEQEPIRPRIRNPKVDRDLETICLRCLAKDPLRRYASADALAKDLNRYLSGEPIRARPTGSWERTVKWVRRRPAAAALIGVICLATVGLLAGSWWHNFQLQGALQETGHERHLAQLNAAEARRQRDLAEKNAAEAVRQGESARASLQRRLDMLDDFLIKIDGRLAQISAANSVRREFLQEMFHLSEGFLKEQKTGESARWQLARIYRRIGDAWSQQDDGFEQTESAYEKALELQDKLAAEFSAKANYKEELALIHANRAKALQNSRRFLDAEKSYGKGIEVQEALARQLPQKPDYRGRATRFRFDLGNLLEEAGRTKEAAGVYRRTLGEQEQLVAQFPNVGAYHSLLAVTSYSLAMLSADADPALAKKLFRRNLAARRQAWLLNPAIRDYSLRWRHSYYDLAEFLKKQKDHIELAKLSEELQNARADQATDTYDAACLMANAGEAVQENNKLLSPERQRLGSGYFVKAVALLDKALKEGYSDRSQINSDQDLNPLRSRQDFKTLLVELDKRFPVSPPTPAKEYQALLQEYERAQGNYKYWQNTARTVAEKKKAERRKPNFEEFAERFLKLAEKHRGAAAGVDALVWILDNSAPDESGAVNPTFKRYREKAVQALERDHFQKAELANVCQKLAETPTPECDHLLASAADKHTQPEVRALAGYALALSLAKQAETTLKENPAKAAECHRRAEKNLEMILAKYPGIAYGNTTLGEAAKTKLHEIRYLAIGRPAPEIDGEDLDGKRFKLSEYRGQVVVLDFWVNWCGYCRQMYGHERQLVARLKDKPFALLGINCDDDREDVKRARDKERLTWRSWWDDNRYGRGRIARDWQVSSFPSIFIIDHKGVIRYKDTEGALRGAGMDAAVEKLLRERDAELRAQKK